MVEMILSSLRMATPLIFAAMGGLLCERSGVATICLEGVMLTAAWAAATTNYLTHNPYLGVVAGLLAGAIAMSLHAFLSVTARADQIVSSVAVNLLAAGVTPFLTKYLFGSSTNTPAIPGPEQMPTLFGQEPLMFLAFLVPFAMHFYVYKTIPGLRMIAAGDSPEALRTAGVSPAKVRYYSLILGGAMASLGGSFLSIAHGTQFTRDMTAGRGFIALTALIFGKWKPIPTLFACLFFGLADAMQIQLQSTTLFGWAVPVQFIQALPYFVTLVVLVGFIGRARPPLAINQPNR